MIMYEMATGVPPYIGATTCRSCTSTCKARPRRRRTSIPAIPDELAAIISKAMSVDKSKRYPVHG